MASFWLIIIGYFFLVMTAVRWQREVIIPGLPESFIRVFPHWRDLKVYGVIFLLNAGSKLVEMVFANLMNSGIDQADGLFLSAVVGIVYVALGYAYLRWSFTTTAIAIDQKGNPFGQSWRLTGQLGVRGLLRIVLGFLSIGFLFVFILMLLAFVFSIIDWQAEELVFNGAMMLLVVIFAQIFASMFAHFYLDASRLVAPVPQEGSIDRKVEE